MAKVAVLASFQITKRMVVDVPEGKDTATYICDEGFVKISEAAAEQFKSDIGNYLIPDNFEVEEDWEIPAEEHEIPSV